MENIGNRDENNDKYNRQQKELDFQERFKTGETEFSPNELGVMQDLIKNYDSADGDHLTNAYQKTIAEQLSLNGTVLTKEQREEINQLSKQSINNPGDLKEVLGKIAEINSIISTANGSLAKQDKNSFDSTKNSENEYFKKLKEFIEEYLKKAKEKKERVREEEGITYTAELGVAQNKLKSMLAQKA